MAAPAATIFICSSCRRLRQDVPEGYDEPGRALLRELPSHLAATGAEGVTLKPVECLAVCTRPCTVALTGEGKWTYVIGDLDPGRHVQEIAAAVAAYARTSNGIVPWRERPQTFRKGVVARVPPIDFVQPPTETP